VSTAAPAEVAHATESESLAAVLRRRFDAFRAGEVGSVPVIAALAAMTIFFTEKNSVFFTSRNFDNLIQQMAGTTAIAMGVVFVLLIGEIDLSIGYASGVVGVAVAEFSQAGTHHNYGGAAAIVLALLIGVAIGLLQGSWFAVLGVPAFVVTLAGLLVWNGVILRALGNEGVIGIQSNLINNIANYIIPKPIGWAVGGGLAAAYALAVAAGWLGRRRAGLPTGNAMLTLLRVVGVTVVTLVVVRVCNHARGVPFVGVLIVALTIGLSLLATRTTFGRHVYAVGGNAEAARRAGINVRFIRIAVFVISAVMAGVGGLIFASRLSAVDLTAGSGNETLLDAIAAAVIGGTSLFGGRGYVRSALLGGAVIATIQNGIDLVGYSEAVKDIVTGIILLAAVTLDTISRRRLASAGR
jgi:D-xylose transport system permease protein